MARRGKTVIKSGPDQAPMQRALEQGEAAIHRASEAKRNQQNTDFQQQRQITSDISQGIGAAQKTYEENKPGGEKEYRREMQERKMSLAEKSATSQAAMQQQRIDLEASKAGRKRGADTPTSPLLDERQKALGAEMDQGGKEMGVYGPDAQGESTQWADQLGVPPTEEDIAGKQRLATQMSKPLGDSMFPLTEEGKKKQQFGQGQEREKRDIARMNALTRRRTAATAYNKSLLAHDKVGKANAKELLMAPVRHGSDARDAMLNDEKPKGQALDWVLTNSTNNEAHDIIKNWDAATPEQRDSAREFINGAIDNTILGYVEDIGEIPDSDYVDLASPKVQTLMQNIALVTKFAKNIGIGGYMGFKTKADSARMAKKIAAGYTNRGLSEAPAALPAPEAQQATEQPGQTSGDPYAGLPGTPGMASGYM